MDKKELFKQACLLQFSSSIWQCSRAIPNFIIENAGPNNEWLRGRKYLINPELLGPIHTSVHQARNKIQDFALPFPVTSIYLIPKEAISTLDNILQGFESRFWEKVYEFTGLYDQARAEAQEMLDDLFDETDYPPDIMEKFKFRWRFLTLAVPGKSSVLPPEIYEREKKKFQDLMDETRELSMLALREEFSSLLGHLVDKLSGNGSKPKMLKNSMFNRLNEFLAEFEVKNIFEDEQLADLTAQARQFIGGSSAYGLKYNKSARLKITEEMKKLKDTIDASIMEMPMRKLRLDDAEVN